jgi:hypothetical protein
MATDMRTLCLERKERSALVQLPAEVKPYRRDDVLSLVLKNCARSDVEAIGQRSNSATWEVTFKDVAKKTAFVEAASHDVKGHSATVSSVKRTGYKMRVLYLPYYVPTSVITCEIEKAATAKIVFQRNETDRNDGMLTNVRFVVAETEFPNRLPDTVKWTFDGEHGTALINLAGREPLCFRCNARGHRRFQCEAPYCYRCRRVGHEEGDEGCTGPSYSRILTGPSTDDEDLVAMDAEDEEDSVEAHGTGGVQEGKEPVGGMEEAGDGGALGAEEQGGVAAGKEVGDGAGPARFSVGTKDDKPQGQDGAKMAASHKKDAAAEGLSSSAQSSWEDQMAAAEKTTGALAAADGPEQNAGDFKEASRAELVNEKTPAGGLAAAADRPKQDGYKLVSGRKRSLSEEKRSAKARPLHKSTEQLVDPTARRGTAPRNPAAAKRGGHAAAPAGKNPVGKNGTLTSADFLKG